MNEFLHIFSYLSALIQDHRKTDLFPYSILLEFPVLCNNINPLDMVQ